MGEGVLPGGGHPVCLRLVVLTIHRPPYYANMDVFFGKLLTILNSLVSREINLILNEDINITFLVGSREYDQLLDILRGFEMKNLLVEPTRIGKTSATGIDYVVVNSNFYSNLMLV